MVELRPPAEIIEEITRLLASMHNEVPPPEPPERLIKSLVDTVKALSQPKKVRPQRCPPDYVEWWKRVGPSHSSELPNRAIRYLSWETDVAITEPFQSVALSPERLSARSLQGLVRSVHRRWSTTVGTPVLTNLAGVVENSPFQNTLIEKWKKGIAFVLTPDSPANLARYTVAGGRTWERTADEWGLELDGEFGNAVLEKCVKLSLVPDIPEAERLQDTVLRHIIPSRHWSPRSFKLALQELIMASGRFSQRHSEILKETVIGDDRLLDPRLPANATNWVGICDVARDQVIQWLSAEDIQLFFDHVLPSRSDPHGRKPFWMNYKGKVKRSRPLLSSLDESRWHANVATSGKRNYGRMEVSVETSAFLLDFGSVLVVEFSKVNNAVFLYRHRDIPGITDDFWSGKRFQIDDLKQQRNCVEKISHNVNWRANMRTILAQFGVHPGG